MIYAGYTCKSRTQTGQVKFENSPGTKEAKVSLGERKNPLSRVSLGLLQRGVQCSVVMIGDYCDITCKGKSSSKA